ncbi:MAG: hypothetical protein AAB429_01990 [Patescibacteria group bacterium]
MQSLKHLVKSAVRRAGISTQVSAAQIVTGVKVFLDAAVLPGLRSSIQIVSFQHGILKVNCANAVAAHELRSLESGVRQVIAETDPQAELRQLVIHLGTPRPYDF